MKGDVSERAQHKVKSNYVSYVRFFEIFNLIFFDAGQQG